MKAIVTIQNNDGTYDEVGMRNRTVFGPYQRDQTIFDKAVEYARGQNHRVEFFHGDNIRGEAYRTVHVTKHNPY